MPAMITVAQLGRIVPRVGHTTVVLWHGALLPEMQAAEITTDARQAGFLASVMNETGGLQAFDEASYFNTGWPRIREIFGGVRGLTEELVNQWRGLGRQAFDVAFFNWVYADENRAPGYRLGNTQPGDGHRYRGMGPGALTGRGNYAWMARETGLPLVEDPESIKRPDVGAKLAAHFWRKNGCNALVDDGSRDGALRAMRKLNAGLRDFSPHMQWWERCRAALADDTIGEAPPQSTSTDRRRTDVRALQEALVEEGFDPGGVDGVVGPRTRAAVVAFQTARGLAADGVAGPITLAALGLA